MIGNVYYIGDDFAGPLLIDTGGGLIVIDTGMPACAPFVIHNIWALGFSPKDVKVILHTHGHFDHLGATMALKKLSGAKVYMSKEDTDMLINRPDLAFMGHTEMGWPLDAVDVELSDGGKIVLGGTEIQCVLTPGHTDGSLSFIFNVTCEGREYRAAMFGGAGLITLRREFLMSHFGNLDNRRKYLESLDTLESFKDIDIVMANHPDMNHTFEKQKYKLAHPSKENPFLNPGEWKEFVRGMREKYGQMLAEEELG